MILYHLEKWKYKELWPPEGSLHADGRWNITGQWIIYTSPTISLAKLEILANEINLPIKRVCFTIELPDTIDVYEISKKKLPPNWMGKPYPTGLAKLTSEFLKKGGLVMQVPSAHSFTENSYLLNVRHPEFHQLVKVINVREEPFDTKLKWEKLLHTVLV